jgi:hypothetical protein
MESIEQALGGLFSIGWTLDECLDLTWPQLNFCAIAVMKHKAEFYSMVMEAVGGALGVGKTGKKKKRKSDNLESSLAAMGIPIRNG